MAHEPKKLPQRQGQSRPCGKKGHIGRAVERGWAKEIAEDPCVKQRAEWHRNIGKARQPALQHRHVDPVDRPRHADLPCRPAMPTCHADPPKLGLAEKGQMARQTEEMKKKLNRTAQSGKTPLQD